ncbi:MAG: hypothetical protein K2H38_09095 [Muribaculaceae bacterium]|nr:hypothetical protein [Muribaculaceae bacterium]MDE6553825.1 hypothetical protein [Muribaculaceae bacterium]
MKKKSHNIICLEAEWLYNSGRKGERFNLKTEPLLNWLKEFHQCDVIYRHILHKADLQHYLDYFKPSRRDFKNHEIVYIACHGNEATIHLEDGYIDLDTLADMANGCFENRIVHFSSCRTLADPEVALRFKARTKARLVSGYTKNVDAMKSAIADMALFNDLMYITTKYGIICNAERSTFRKTYRSLLEELGFEAY